MLSSAVNNFYFGSLQFTPHSKLPRSPQRIDVWLDIIPPSLMSFRTCPQASLRPTVKEKKKKRQ